MKTYSHYRAMQDHAIKYWKRDEPKQIDVCLYAWTLLGLVLVAVVLLFGRG